jgi:hypothetical protein
LVLVASLKMNTIMSVLGCNNIIVEHFFSWK